MPDVRFGLPQEMFLETVKLPLRNTTKPKQELCRAASFGEEIRFHVCLASEIPLGFIWKDKKRHRNYYSNGFASNQRSINYRSDSFMYVCLCKPLTYV